MPESAISQEQKKEYANIPIAENKQYWNRLYFLVIALHTIVIILFYWLTMVYA